MIKLNEIENLMLVEPECKCKTILCRCGNSISISESGGWEKAIKQQGNRKITINRQKLAELLRDHRLGHPGFPLASWDYYLADDIISEEYELIEYVP